MDPDQLRADLDRMIEQKRAATYSIDPEKEAKQWTDRLAEVERNRAKDQEMFRADAMTLDELKANQARLEEARKTAERELAALRDREEHGRDLEQRRDALLDSLEATTPEALDSLTPEERNQFYKLLELLVEVGPDSRPDISGRALPESFEAVSDFETWSLATLHTNDAAGALPRLTNMGIDPFLSTSAIGCLVAQRLVRRLCERCKQPASASETVLRHVGFPFDLFEGEPTLYRPVGCEECRNGYLGRIGIYDVLPQKHTTSRFRFSILLRDDAQDISFERVAG